MNAVEIIEAIDKGKHVYYLTYAYEVIEDSKGEYVIESGNGHRIGLTWADGVTLNGNEGDFCVL